MKNVKIKWKGEMEKFEVAWCWGVLACPPKPWRRRSTGENEKMKE